MPDQAALNSPWDAPEEIEAFEPVRPPSHLLVLAGLTLAVSAVLLVIGGLAVNVAGYVLAGFVATGLVTAFSRVNNRRRLNPYYSPERGSTRAVPVLSFVALLIAFGHVWPIATRFAS